MEPPSPGIFHSCLGAIPCRALGWPRRAGRLNQTLHRPFQPDPFGILGFWERWQCPPVGGTPRGWNPWLAVPLPGRGAQRGAQVRAAALRQRFPAGVRAERSPGGSPGATSGGGHGDSGGQVGTGRDRRARRSSRGAVGLWGCGCGPERDGGLGNAGEVGGRRRWCAQGHPALSGTEFTSGTDIKYLIIAKSARQPAVVFSRRFRWFLIW